MFEKSCFKKLFFINIFFTLCRFTYEYKDRMMAGMIIGGWDPVEGPQVTFFKKSKSVTNFVEII